ncbi:hypothetical protein [Vulgatibacter sp.]|uniref:hypothetical protein n=1 Tax=Vulgatibacter sp. TaxID=1971226 RepID=UPI0035671BF6
MEPLLPRVNIPNSARFSLPALLALLSGPTMALVLACGDDGPRRTADNSTGGWELIGAGGAGGDTGGGGGGGAGGGLACGGDPSLVECGDDCVDTQVDPRHCGGCGNACAAGEACLEGECQLVCHIGETTVAAGEADPANPCVRCDPARSTSDWSPDPDGTACGTGQICVDAACTPACLIDGEVHAAGLVNPANACEHCEPAASTSAWSVRPSFPLLVGGTDVEAQGWSIISQPVSSLTSEGDATQLVTSTDAGASTGGQLLLSRPHAYEAGEPFTIQFELQVVSVAAHNTLDSAAAILGSFSGSFGNGTERSQMIYLDEGAIGWADDSGSAAVDTTGASHVYELSVDAEGVATFSVDGAALLTRSGFASNGTIAIGDQTNDPNVDGTMRIRSVTRICP